MNDGDDHEAIRRRKTDEFWRRIAGGFERLDDKTVPFLGENFRVFVGLNVNGDYFRGKARGEFEAVASDLAIVIDRDDGNRF